MIVFLLTAALAAEPNDVMGSAMPVVHNWRGAVAAARREGRAVVVFHRGDDKSQYIARLIAAAPEGLALGEMDARANPEIWRLTGRPTVPCYVQLYLTGRTVRIGAVTGPRPPVLATTTQTQFARWIDEGRTANRPIQQCVM